MSEPGDMVEARILVFDQPSERSGQSADFLMECLYKEPGVPSYGSDGVYGHDPESARQICELTELTHDFTADPVPSTVCMEPDFADTAEGMAEEGWDVTRHDATFRSKSTGAEETVNLGYDIDIAASQRNFSSR